MEAYHQLLVGSHDHLPSADEHITKSLAVRATKVMIKPTALLSRQAGKPR